MAEEVENSLRLFLTKHLKLCIVSCCCIDRVAKSANNRSCYYHKSSRTHILNYSSKSRPIGFTSFLCIQSSFFP